MALLFHVNLEEEPTNLPNYGLAKEEYLLSSALGETSRQCAPLAHILDQRPSSLATS
jgi:hypothetical protein